MLIGKVHNGNDLRSVRLASEAPGDPPKVVRRLAGGPLGPAFGLSGVVLRAEATGMLWRLERL